MIAVELNNISIVFTLLSPNHHQMCKKEMEQNGNELHSPFNITERCELQ